MRPVRDGGPSISTTTTDDAPDAAPWWRRWWPLLAVAALFALGALVLIGFLGVVYARAQVPDPDELVIPNPTVIVDAYEQRVGTYELAALRKNIQVEELPEHVPQAFMAAEDRRFYQHPGFSPGRIVTAFWDNLTSEDELEGASTITQQYVELAVEEVARTYVGKLREIALAYKLEQKLSKDAILERYLNAVPLGRTAIGIEAAARTYFGKGAHNLTVNEAATLAGMVAAPTRFDPARNPELANQRRIYTLRGMVAQGWLDEQLGQQLIEAGLPEVSDQPLVEFGPNAWYLQTVRDDLARLADELGVEDVARGLVVHTKLNTPMQAQAVEQLGATLEDVPYQGALVSIDPQDGGIMAIVGQKGMNAEGLNLALEPAQQAGSAFKPFTLSAFVGEGWSPDSDYRGPSEIDLDLDGNDDDCGSDYEDNEDGENGARDIYEVSNYAGAAFGEITVRRATTNSVNTVYVQMQQDLCTEPVVDVATAMLGREDPLPSIASLTLGTVEVSPLEMASAYATIANGGLRYDPFTITEVVDQRTGEVLFEQEQDPERVLESSVAAVVTDVLTDVVEEGTATAADIERPAAGKTGTTQDYKDAWFVGYVPQLATAVWVGYPDNREMETRVTGGSLPAATWGDYMAAVLEGQDVMEFPEPDTSDLEEIDGSDRSFSSDDDEPAPTTDATGGAPAPSETDGASPAPTPGDASPTPTAGDDGQPTTPPGGGDDDTPTPTETDEEPVPTDEPTSDPAPEPTPTSDGGADGGGSGGSSGGGGGGSSGGDATSDDDAQAATSDSGDSPTPAPSEG